MIELPLVFLGGLLGSAHCVGMCGGFALMVGSGARGLGANVRRQVVYSLGRLFTYSVCGAALGYAGMRLVEDASAVINAQAALAIVAGVLLVVQGLLSAGVVSRGRRLAEAAIARWKHRDSLAVRPARHGATLGCLATGMLGSFLRAPGLGLVFLAGMLTGFLPCGLVYAYLALAASATGMFGGLSTMAAFGLGTFPLMILTGSGASLVSLGMRQRLFRIAAWCVVLTGLMSLARGFGALNVAPSQAASNACPMCR